MGLSMAEQKAVTWELADRHQGAPKEAKGDADPTVAPTGWNRS